MKRSAPPAQFAVSDRAEGGRHVIALTGELDIASAPALETKVGELCGDGAAAIVIDLSQLTFIDSTGLRTLLSVQSACKERACDFSLVPGQESVQRLFVLTGLLEHLPFHENGSKTTT
jgi:anti-sigma B factor antagonist